MNPEKKSISELAYEIWESRGRRHDSAVQDWIEAERQHGADTATTRELKADPVDESLMESFPASDPPASHLPDTAPSGRKGDRKSQQS